MGDGMVALLSSWKMSRDNHEIVERNRNSSQVDRCWSRNEKSSVKRNHKCQLVELVEP